MSNMKENFGDFLICLCYCILLSEVYCVWQVVETRIVFSNNPVYPMQHFPFGAAFVCKGGNIRKILRNGTH
jgi:hypothetical protein